MRILRVSLVLLLILVNFAYSKILMQPYLQALSSSGVCIMVETDAKDPVKVEFGNFGVLNKSANTNFYLPCETEGKPSYVHRIILSGLDPYTTYKYKARQGDSKSAEYSFRTAPTAGATFRIGVMGDCRSNPKVHNEIAKRMLAFEPVFSIYTGDLCGNSSYERWKSQFFVENELELSSRVAFFNAVGNHEGWKANTKAFTQAPSTNSGTQEYYSFDIGDAHILILSTESSCCKDSEQWKFIENDLKNSRAKWNIAAFHESAYCYGGHGNNSMMKTVSENLFKKYKVSMVITGHSHFYQHNYVDGIHHFTVAGGGAPLYDPESSPNTIKSAKEFHFGIIDASPNSLKITIYNIEGKIIDTLELK